MNLSRETQQQVYGYLEAGLFSPKYVSPLDLFAWLV